MAAAVSGASAVAAHVVPVAASSDPQHQAQHPMHKQQPWRPRSLQQQQQHHEQLTRADIRDEIVAALADFAEDALRRELNQLGILVEKAVQQAAETAAAAAKAAVAGPAVTEVFLPGSAPAAPGRDAGGGFSPEDFRVVLDDWWASMANRHAPILKPGRDRTAHDFETAPSPLNRQHSPSTTGGTRSRSAESYDHPTPPQSPLCLPPALDTTITETFSMPPMASPCSGPVSCPATPLMQFSLNHGSSSKKDWRRSFVEKAFKGNRKIEFINGAHCRETHEVIEVMEEAIQALEDGIAPNLVEDGLGGTYFLKDRDGASIAVFKPRDEEPLAMNNPKTHAGEGWGAGLKEGVLVGDASLNEYAAFLIDQASSPALRAGVCPTALVRVANSVFFSAKERRNSAFRVIKDKVGSFQLFAQHDCTSEDLGPSKFPVDQAHRIAVLDIRLCNTDRHSGNILVREQGHGHLQLVPIDHGYALPSEVGGAAFEWLSWSASKASFSEEMKRDILAIDLDCVEASLRKKVPAMRDECFATLRICTKLLQAGVEAGLTAYDIGMMMTRPEDGLDGLDAQDNFSRASPHTMSVLESLIASAKQQAKVAGEPEAFERLLDGLLHERCVQAAATEAVRRKP
mmetsp:Transcript_131071/g.379199  ORF Transcript_131071/g.379199 Transcript_131071/m.379199 type:complete len:628 (+) Transcript_131071:118-2001(+)